MIITCPKCGQALMNEDNRTLTDTEAAELARSAAGTAPPAISKIKQTLNNIFHTITTFFRIR